MAKKIESYIKLQIPAGEANPSPPIGPALGQKGINIVKFCKDFNLQTSAIEKGLIIPVIIYIYSDKTFSFKLKSSPASVLLKKAAGILVGSKKPKIEKVGSVTKSQLYEIAKLKSSDMTGSNMSAIIKSIEGTAYTIGLDIKDD